MVLKQLRGLSSAKRLYKTIIYNPSRTIICSTSTHLTQRLIQEPVSRIKATLDSEITNENIEILWDSILTSVHHHSPPKAQLVRITSLTLILLHLGRLIRC
ncbi:hypothetical protein Hanom_Chr02g00141631 [Helianthus anomalus]